MNRSDPQLDMDRIAKALGAERRGTVASGGGYFGAVQLAAEVGARFRVPDGGGRATDPSWGEQRLIRLSAATLEQLGQLAERAHASPMQVAALLLERAVRSAAQDSGSGETGASRDRCSQRDSGGIFLRPLGSVGKLHS